MRRREHIFGLALMALCGCGGKPALKGAGGPRVVSLHDVTTQIALELGAHQQLVGVSKAVDESRQMRDGLNAVPLVEGLESILAVRPTLVTGLSVVERQNPELVRALRAKGIEVYLSDPQTLDDTSQLVLELGKKLDRSDVALAYAAKLDSRVHSASTPTESPIRVFVYDCCNPPFTSGSKTVLNEILERAGAHNIFSDVDSAWMDVSWEEVLRREPEHIIVHDYSYGGQADVEKKLRTLKRFPSLANLPVTQMTLGYALGGPRSVDGLEMLQASFGGNP